MEAIDTTLMSREDYLKVLYRAVVNEAQELDPGLKEMGNNL